MSADYCPVRKKRLRFDLFLFGRSIGRKKAHFFEKTASQDALGIAISVSTGFQATPKYRK
jgi:hypothetical protein